MSDFLINWALALRETLPFLGIWFLASIVLGFLAGPFLAMSNPDPHDRRVWKRRRSDG